MKLEYFDPYTIKIKSYEHLLIHLKESSGVFKHLDLNDIDCITEEKELGYVSNISRPFFNDRYVLLYNYPESKIVLFDTVELKALSAFGYKGAVIPLLLPDNHLLVHQRLPEGNAFAIYSIEKQTFNRVNAWIVKDGPGSSSLDRIYYRRGNLFIEEKGDLFCLIPGRTPNVTTPIKEANGVVEFILRRWEFTNGFDQYSPTIPIETFDLFSTKITRGETPNAFYPIYGSGIVVNCLGFNNISPLIPKRLFRFQPQQISSEQMIRVLDSINNRVRIENLEVYLTKRDEHLIDSLVKAFTGRRIDHLKVRVEFGSRRLQGLLENAQAYRSKHGDEPTFRVIQV